MSEGNNTFENWWSSTPILGESKRTIAMAAYAVAQSELAALREELAIVAGQREAWKETSKKIYLRKLSAQQRLADAEQRNAALAELLSKGFNCIEQSGGKYRITMDFGSGDECFEAYSALCNLCRRDSLVREPQPTESGASE